MPGMLGSTRFWRIIAEKLSKDHRVILIDLLGFGRSPKPKNIEYTLQDHVECIAKTLQNIGMKDKATLIGHSMGALLALAYAAKNNDKVKKLVLTSPPIFKSKEEAKENIIAYSALPKVFLYGPISRITCKLVCNFSYPIAKHIVTFFLRELPRDVASDTLLHTWYSYSLTLKHVVEDQDVFQTIKDIDVPIHILYGENDPRVNEEYLHTVKKLNTQVTMKKIQSAGHMLPLTHTNEVLRAIVE